MLLADATPIGGQMGATLTSTTDIREVVTKSRNRQRGSMPGKESWEIAFDGLYLENQEEIIGNGNVQIKVDTGGGAYEIISGATQLGLSLAMEIAERAGLDKELLRYLKPSTRSHELSVEGKYHDPASTAGAGFKYLQTAKESGSRVTLQLTLGGATFEGEFTIGEIQIEVPPEEVATYSLSFTGHDVLTYTSGSVDTGLAVLLDNYFANPTPALTALIQVQDEAGAKLAGATKYSGSVYPTSIEITMPEAEEVQVSGTLAGDGPLNTAAQTVAA